MKILHLNVTYSSGSTGSIIRNINERVKNIFPAVETHVAYSVGNSGNDGYKFINKTEYFIVRAMRKLFGKSLYGLYLPTKRLIRHIKKLNPDVIHIHTIHHQTLHYKTLLDFLKNFEGKVIYTLHDCWPFTGGCYYYSDAGCSDFTNGCEHCHGNQNVLDCKIPRTGYEFAQKKAALNAIPNITFAAVSNWLAEEARTSFLKDKPIVTVHNGIDSEKFKPLNLSKNETFTAISVAAH